MGESSLKVALFYLVEFGELGPGVREGESLSPFENKKHLGESQERSPSEVGPGCEKGGDSRRRAR